MADDFETFDDSPMGGVTAPQIAELPEIKLFGRWSCDDVQVNDISLQVKFVFYSIFVSITRDWMVRQEKK